MINYLGTFPLVVPILEISVMQGQVLPEERAAGGRDFNHGRARINAAVERVERYWC